MQQQQPPTLCELCVDTAENALPSLTGMVTDWCCRESVEDDGCNRHCDVTLQEMQLALSSILSSSDSDQAAKDAAAVLHFRLETRRAHKRSSSNWDEDVPESKRSCQESCTSPAYSVDT